MLYRVQCCHNPHSTCQKKKNLAANWLPEWQWCVSLTLRLQQQLHFWYAEDSILKLLMYTWIATTIVSSKRWQQINKISLELHSSPLWAFGCLMCKGAAWLAAMLYHSTTCSHSTVFTQTQWHTALTGLIPLLLIAYSETSAFHEWKWYSAATTLLHYQVKFPLHHIQGIYAIAATI